MTIAQLRYVTEVEQAGSITKAARTLYMGQPNLSKAIRELENEIGITIFRRTPQGVEPTELGAQFLAYAKSILSQMDALESLYKQQPAQEFRFSVSAPRTAYVSAAFTDFLSEVPDDCPMETHFKETSSMEAITDVTSGISELAIIRVPDPHREYYRHFLQNMKLRWQTLWEFHMCLLMSESHPLSYCTEIPYHMLDGYVEICQGDLQAPNVSLSQAQKGLQMQGHKRRIYIYERGAQYELLKRIPGAFMWVAPVPLPLLAEQHLIMKECPRSSMLTQDLVICREDHTFTASEQRFLELADRYTHNILHPESPNYM